MELGYWACLGVHQRDTALLTTTTTTAATTIKKRVEYGVGGGAHAHRKNPEPHCEGACTRIGCWGLLGQVAAIPSVCHHF